MIAATCTALHAGLPGDELIVVLTQQNVAALNVLKALRGRRVKRGISFVGCSNACFFSSGSCCLGSLLFHMHQSSFLSLSPLATAQGLRGREARRVPGLLFRVARTRLRRRFAGVHARPRTGAAAAAAADRPLMISHLPAHTAAPPSVAAETCHPPQTPQTQGKTLPKRAGRCGVTVMTFGTMGSSAGDPEVVSAPESVRCLIVDEASQAWSAQTFLLDRAFPAVSRLYLFGDDKQLPPVILATNARGDEQADLVAAGVQSLYGVAKASGHRLHALRVQYRMPRVLAEFVSRHFYGGELVTPPGEKYDDLGAVVWCARGNNIILGFAPVLPIFCCQVSTGADCSLLFPLAGSSRRATRGTRPAAAAPRG